MASFNSSELILRTEHKTRETKRARVKEKLLFLLLFLV